MVLRVAGLMGLDENGHRILPQKNDLMSAAVALLSVRAAGGPIITPGTARVSDLVVAKSTSADSEANPNRIVRISDLSPVFGTAFTLVLEHLRGMYGGLIPFDNTQPIGDDEAVVPVSDSGHGRDRRNLDHFFQRMTEPARCRFAGAVAACALLALARADGAHYRQLEYLSRSAMANMNALTLQFTEYNIDLDDTVSATNPGTSLTWEASVRTGMMFGRR